MGFWELLIILILILVIAGVVWLLVKLFKKL